MQNQHSISELKGKFDMLDAHPGGDNETTIKIVSCLQSSCLASGKRKKKIRFDREFSSLYLLVSFHTSNVRIKKGCRCKDLRFKTQRHWQLTTALN